MLSAGACPPFFVFGFERSGNTLLAMMLGAHPNIAVPLSTTGMWLRYAERLNDYARLAATNDMERLVDDLLAEQRIRLWDVQLTRAYEVACAFDRGGRYTRLLRRWCLRR